MWPLLYENPEHNIQVGTYGVLMILGFSLGFLFINGRAKYNGLNPDHLVGAYLAAAIGGFVGARVFTALTVDLAKTLSDPMSLFSMDGLTYYGGLLGGILAVLIVAKIQGFLGWAFLDLAAPAVIIGHTIGRLGCFFGGCCHGAPVVLSHKAFRPIVNHPLQGEIWLDVEPPFLATEFSAGVGRYNDMTLYPTQLWSVLAGAFLLILLIRTLDGKRFDGQVVALMFFFEPLIRFFIELFRGDARGVVLELPIGTQISSWFPGLAHASSSANIGLTTSQVMGVGLMAIGALIWLIQHNKPLRWR